jgi:hypothetical protein
MKDNRREYSRAEVRFILDHYVNRFSDWQENPKLCKLETGHSFDSVKMLLQNIRSNYTDSKFGKGNPMYSEVFEEYRRDNSTFGTPMSIEKFIALFL